MQLSSLPCQSRAQADEDQPGKPLLQSGNAGVAAQEFTQRAAGISHAQIHQSAAEIEYQAQENDWPDDAATAGVDKLRKKGQEEESDFRVEQICDHALAENR